MHRHVVHVEHRTQHRDPLADPVVPHRLSRHQVQGLRERQVHRRRRRRRRTQQHRRSHVRHVLVRHLAVRRDRVPRRVLHVVHRQRVRHVRSVPARRQAHRHPVGQQRRRDHRHALIHRVVRHRLRRRRGHLLRELHVHRRRRRRRRHERRRLHVLQRAHVHEPDRVRTRRGRVAQHLHVPRLPRLEPIRPQDIPLTAEAGLRLIHHHRPQPVPRRHPVRHRRRPTARVVRPPRRHLVEPRHRERRQEPEVRRPVAVPHRVRAPVPRRTRRLPRPCRRDVRVQVVDGDFARGQRRPGRRGYEGHEHQDQATPEPPAGPGTTTNHARTPVCPSTPALAPPGLCVPSAPHSTPDSARNLIAAAGSTAVHPKDLVSVVWRAMDGDVPPGRAPTWTLPPAGEEHHTGAIKYTPPGAGDSRDFRRLRRVGGSAGRCQELPTATRLRPWRFAR